MPIFTKRTISNYLRSECKRRLALDLWPDANQFQQQRALLGMPPRHVARPGLNLLAEQGEEWEEAKIQDLVQTLGMGALVGTVNPRAGQAGQPTFIPERLDTLLTQVVPGNFLVQAQFAVSTTFESALNIDHYRNVYQLQYAQLRPDLIHVLNAGGAQSEVTPNGSLQPVPSGDTRCPLRIIDIKLTSEPSNSHFAEVTYYAMAMAGWLVDQGLDTQFFVTPAAAVWPGSHDASSLVRLQRERRTQGLQPTIAELLDALEDDLETVPLDVFAVRLRRFFREELDEALRVPWQQLEWHVDNRCSGCDYLGYTWNPNQPSDPAHCWPMAQATGHLSQVPFVSKGARGILEHHHLRTVQALAGAGPNHPALLDHQSLRATRTVVSSRAQALHAQQVITPPQAGTSAVLPRWSDLRLYVSADFDIGSGLTAAFGFKAFFYNNQANPNTFRAGPQVFPVDQRDPMAERRELISFLNALDQEINNATQALPTATLQVYVWDTVTLQHIVRVIGRHLPFLLGANQVYRRLIWLFPPEDVIQNPSLSDRKSPIAIVRDAVRAVTAVPVPHYYTLLNVARQYPSARTPAQYTAFRISPFFEDPLTDQIPSERIHEVWVKAPQWHRTLSHLDMAVQVKLHALESVTQRLEEDLQGQLDQTAPRIDTLRPPTLPARMAPDSRLWYLFAQLNVALDELDVQQVRAMPEHEREARFRSALLTRRLTGPAEAAVLQRAGLPQVPTLRVYELAPGSLEFKAKEGDFTFALAPIGNGRFLGQQMNRLLTAANLTPAAVGMAPTDNQYALMERVTKVTIRHIDRDRGVVALELDPTWSPVIGQLEAQGAMDLTQNVSLDPIHADYLVDRLRDTLNAIGNPPIAVPSPVLNQVLGSRNPQRSGRDAITPVGQVLWDAATLFGVQVPRNLAPIRALLSANGYALDPSQWIAWEGALSRRLSLIWGPPGTGKSKTLRALVLGALHAAVRGAAAPIRLLVTGPTYEAIDNVLLECARLVGNAGVFQVPNITVARLRSRFNDPPTAAQNFDVETGSAVYNQLLQDLGQLAGPFVIGGTPQQIHKLLRDSGGAVTPLFDLIIIDEASQMDVATATLPLAGLSAQGAVVVAGDPKQLPPIHQARPAEDVAAIVGPIYTYLESRHNIRPDPLETNYRSNQEIVSVGYEAGYRRSLRANTPGLRLQLAQPLAAGTTPPKGWPQHLPWSPEWAVLLEPDQPVVCFIYHDGRSSQSNAFEADAVAALVSLLAPALVDSSTGQHYGPTAFWAKGIGVVTPHRAQQAQVIQQLQRAFPGHPTAGIRSAVDTVERFQGQERDVIIGSYAIGDPDTIRSEEEFLMSLNRFNVMASRAKAKLIVFGSRELVDYLASDLVVLHESALLKRFVETFCGNERLMILPCNRPSPGTVEGEFRWH